MKKKIAALLLLGMFVIAGCGAKDEAAVDPDSDYAASLEAVKATHDGMIPYLAGVDLPPEETYDYDTDTVYTNLMPIVLFVNPFDEDITFRVKSGQDLICESVTECPDRVYAFKAWATFSEDTRAEIEAVSKTGEVLGRRSIFFDTTPQEELLNDPSDSLGT